MIKTRIEIDQDILREIISSPAFTKFNELVENTPRWQKPEVDRVETPPPAQEKIETVTYVDFSKIPHLSALEIDGNNPNDWDC